MRKRKRTQKGERGDARKKKRQMRRREVSLYIRQRRGKAEKTGK